MLHAWAFLAVGIEIHCQIHERAQSLTSLGNVTDETAFGRTGSRLAVFDSERKFLGLQS